MNTNYREYKEGDTVKVTGYQGRLFGSCGRKTLNGGLQFGVECVLARGEDDECDVRLPEGILSDGDCYISVACIELVKAVEETPVEEKPAIIEHKENCSVFVVNSGDNNRWLAKIWYDGGVPKEVAEACANIIKATYDATN